MSLESEELELIRQHAVMLMQNPDHSEIRQRFLALVDECEDRAGLEALAEKLAASPETAVPVLERVLRFDPRDVGILLRIGFLHFMAGEDETAAERLKQAKAIEGETVRVLKLEGTLARDDEEKRRIYTKLMTMDPSDRDIWQYLIALKK